MQRYPSNIDYINHDYKVAIHPYSYHHKIMKLIILRLCAVNKRHSFSRVSQKFESIVNLAREITWQHDTRESWRLHEWQPFTSWSKSRSGSYLTLVPSSTRMPRRTHRGCPDTIPYDIHKEVGYCPTQRHMMLVSLRDPMKSVCASTQLKACPFGPNRHGP
jgi:hypothetical protein